METCHLRAQRRVRAAIPETNRKPLHRKAPSGASEPVPTQQSEDLQHDSRSRILPCVAVVGMVRSSSDPNGQRQASSTHTTAAALARSSRSGRSEQIRSSWSHVLHRAAELLLHRTCGIQPWTNMKFLVSLASGDPQNSDERGSSKVTGKFDEQQLSLIHSAGWGTKNSTSYLQWELQHGHNKSTPDVLRKDSAPWNSSSGGGNQARDSNE